MIHKKGIVTHMAVVIILVIAIWGVVAYLLISKGVIKLPGKFSLKQEPKVELKTEYKNPFDKKTQYVNPIDQFKNPFVTLR